MPVFEPEWATFGAKAYAGGPTFPRISWDALTPLWGAGIIPFRHQQTVGGGLRAESILKAA